MGAFWLKDPGVLFRKGNVTRVWPASGMSKDEKLNAITRLVLALTLLGYLLTRTTRIAIAIFVCLLSIHTPACAHPVSSMLHSLQK